MQNDFEAIASSRSQSQVLSAAADTSPPPTQPFAVPPSDPSATVPNKLHSQSDSITQSEDGSPREASVQTAQVVTWPGLRAVRTVLPKAAPPNAIGSGGVGTQFESADAGLRGSSGRRSSLKAAGVVLASIAHFRVPCPWSD
jgi:hypothetical protein